MHLIRLMLRSAPRLFSGAVVCGLISGLASAALVAITGQMLSQGELPASTLLIAFVVAGVVGLSARIGSQVLLTRLQHTVLNRLRMQLSRRILSSPLRHVENTGPALLLGALIEDTLSISHGLVTLPFISVNVAIVISCLGYLLWLSWPMFIGLVIFMTLGIFSYWLPASRGFVMLEKERETQDSLFRHLRALLDGIKELKLHRQRRDAFLEGELQPTANQLQTLGRGSGNMFAISSSWGMFLFFAFIAVLLFLLKDLVGATPRETTGFVLTTLYLQQPLQLIMDYMPLFAQGNIAYQKVEKLGLSLSAEPETAAAAAAPQAPPAPSTLEFAGLCHTYHRENEEGGFVLGPLQLSLRRGELIFLVGGNGSGKTTLAKLLTGLYVPEAGQILVDGVAVTDANREQYRQNFSAVFSDFHLFDKLLGLPPSELEARARTYLAKFLLDRKVQIDAGKLSTTSLSQGQRKRLALLITYLEDRPFYLFDEWAADQDPLFKELFYRELLPELRNRGKLVVAITHDDHYFHLADRILKLDSGKLSELAPERLEPRGRSIA
jgi:putative pyoverdin transport system ATP-binding/permease protein